MKTWIKCVVLALSSIISFVMLCTALVVGTEAIMGSLSAPATASLPILGMLTATVALILFSVWCFVYTKENKRKGLGFTAVIFGAVAVLAFFISPIVNSAIGNDGNVTINQSSGQEYAAYEEYSWCLDFGEFMDAELARWSSDDDVTVFWYEVEHLREDKLQQYIDYHIEKGFTYSYSSSETHFLLREEKAISIAYFEEAETFMVMLHKQIGK